MVDGFLVGKTARAISLTGRRDCTYSTRYADPRRTQLCLLPTVQAPESFVPPRPPCTKKLKVEHTPNLVKGSLPNAPPNPAMTKKARPPHDPELVSASRRSPPRAHQGRRTTPLPSPPPSKMTPRSPRRAHPRLSRAKGRTRTSLGRPGQRFSWKGRATGAL